VIKQAPADPRIQRISALGSRVSQSEQKVSAAGKRSGAKRSRKDKSRGRDRGPRKRSNNK